MRPSRAYQWRFSFAIRGSHRSRELALALTCALLILACSANAAADAAGHSIPPRIGANTLRHTNSNATLGHQNNSHDRDDRKHDQHHEATQQRPAIAPEQAAQRARERFGGRVLNVILEHGPGGPYYRVKLLKHGRVRVVDIDARR